MTTNPTTPAVRTTDAGDLLEHHAEQVRRVTLAWLIGQRSPNTRRAYRHALAVWHAWCQDHRIDPSAPDRATVTVWVAQMTQQDRLAPDTVRQRVAAVKGWLDELAYADLCPGSAVFAGAHLPPRRAPQLMVLDTGTVADMLRAARTLPTPAETTIALLATAGLRASEAGTVGADSLSTSPWGTVMTVVGKGGKGAIIPVHRLVLEAAARHGWPADWPGTDDPGKRVRRWVTATARAARIHPAPTPHQFRHWFVTTALDAGVPLHIVQDAARHADPATTRGYDRQAGGMRAAVDVADALAARLAG